MSDPVRRVYVASAAAERMFEEAGASVELETGGILVGRRFVLPEGPALLVIAASGPGPAAERGPDYFAPDVAALQRELEILRDRYAAFRVDYVGQWHTHPAGAHHLSYGDLQQIEAILDDPAYVLPYGILTPLVSSETGQISPFYVSRTARKLALLSWSRLEGDPGQLLADFAAREAAYAGDTV